MTSPRAEYQRRFYSDPANRAKRQAWRKQHRLNNPEKHKARRRIDKGLPLPTRTEPANCECCGKASSDLKQSLSLDHCHETNAFRGWLCMRCNSGIAYLGDTEDGIKKALEYFRLVKRASPGTTTQET